MYKRKKHEPRKCEICGSAYTPVRSNQKTCGNPKCKKELSRIRNNNWHKQNYISENEKSGSHTSKEDTIVAIGYAERQIQKTLSMVSKIDTTI